MELNTLSAKINVAERVKALCNIYLKLKNKPASTDVDAVYNEIMQENNKTESLNKDTENTRIITENKKKANEILKETDKYASLQCEEQKSDSNVETQAGILSGLSGMGLAWAGNTFGMSSNAGSAIPVAETDHRELDQTMFSQVGEETLENVVKKSNEYVKVLESTRDMAKKYYDAQCGLTKPDTKDPMSNALSNFKKEAETNFANVKTKGGSRRRRKTTKKRSKKSKKRRGSKK